MTYFQNLHDTFLVTGDVDGLEDFTVLATSEFADKLVIVLLAPFDHVRFIVPVFAGSMRIYIGINSGTTRQRHLQAQVVPAHDLEETSNEWTPEKTTAREKRRNSQTRVKPVENDAADGNDSRIVG